MKKMMLIGMVVVMMLGLVGCNSEEKEIVEKIQSEEEVEGFVPTQIEEENQEVADVVEEVIDTENLQKYYDATQYVGTPRLDEARFFVEKDENIIIVSGVTFTTYIEYTDELDFSKTYQCIVVDNNTGTIEDDVLAYIFTE